MLSRGLAGRGTGEMAAPAGAHGRTAGSPAIQEKELTLFAAHLPPAKQVSDPLLIGGVPLDAFLVFLFLGNLAYLLLRRALDGRVSHGTAAIVQYGGHHRRGLRRRPVPLRLRPEGFCRITRYLHSRLIDTDHTELPASTPMRTILPVCRTVLMQPERVFFLLCNGVVFERWIFSDRTGIPFSTFIRAG